MGLRPCDFEMMTPAEFWYAYVGYCARERQREQAAWERTRWQSWVLTSIQLERKDRRSMTEMFPLPWDKASLPEASAPAQELSIDERRQRVAAMMEGVIPKKEKQR